MINLNSTDPSHVSYYIPVVLILIILLLILEFIIYYLKNSQIDMNSSMNNTLQAGVSYSPSFIMRKNTLKFRYLVGYTLTRASMWSKAPYLYTLYNLYHGFTMPEIGVLYIIDAVSAFIAGPITGALADKYGRKLFSQFYNFLVIVNTMLRMTGNRPIAYLAQVMTGISGGLIMTVFESWVVAESHKEFDFKIVEKERFLKKLFKTQNVLDAIMSVLLSAICAVAYSLWGLFAPLWISIFFSILGMFSIQAFWAENKPEENISKGMARSFSEAFSELKKREVLSMGIIESIFQAVLNIYLFAWTPILQNSTTSKNINVGFIFTSFIFSMILVSYIDSFVGRLCLLAAINGVSGFIFPLNSIIKSRILVEEHRATLMSIFRIPLNIYVIIVLVALRYMNPFSICLIACVMLTVAFITAISLVIWKPKPIVPKFS